ncbi:MAG: 50S ribosomal protein L2 [Alphaproteobacteria bacterium]|nr:50S ribosomal protein L2 [Alphaproteobacteria bacterium]
MALRSLKPVTPSQRHTVLVNRSDLWKGDPVKSLTKGKAKTGARNNNGRITVRSRGGGARKVLREVDFKRKKHGIPAVVERIEYDPNRTAYLALLKYEDGFVSYVLAADGMTVGQVVESGEAVDIKPGNAMRLKNIPTGTMVHNVELRAGKGGQMARSAGTAIQLLGKDDKYAQLRLASGERRMVEVDCFATVGVVSNTDHKNTSLGKAGRSRWLGRRPHVRGVAMNPVDHPHGGGEGKTSGGRHPVTPWGKPTKGKRTRNNKRTDYLIIRRRNATKGK